MNSITITMVKIYLTEDEGRIDTLVKRLHDWEKIRGVTVYRAISGFGKSGALHSSRFADMSLNLPVVVEFFDEPQKIELVLEHLSGFIDSEHIVFWNANLVVGSKGTA